MIITTPPIKNPMFNNVDATLADGWLQWYSAIGDVLAGDFSNSNRALTSTDITGTGATLRINYRGNVADCLFVYPNGLSSSDGSLEVTYTLLDSNLSITVGNVLQTASAYTDGKLIHIPTMATSQKVVIQGTVFLA
jgi:hypothetical protein